MAKFALIFVAAIAFHCVLAAPSGPAETTGEAANIIVNLFKELSAEVEKHVPDSKQVVKSVSETSQELAKNLEGIVTKWKTEADKHKGEFSAAADSVFGQLSKAVGDLQKLATPAEGTHAAELKAKFDNNIKELTTAGDKLKEDFKPYFEKTRENLEKLGTAFLDGVWSFGKTVQSHVDALTKTDNAATHA